MPRNRRIFVVLVAALVTASWLVAAAPAAHSAPPNGPVFNNPKGDYDARWRVVRTIDRAVREAPSGSRIMFSTFLMDSKASADALIAARRRGVQVQIVMDGDDARTRQARRVAQATNEDNRPALEGTTADGTPLRWGPDGSFVRFCEGSCRGGEANNHAKFYAFTRTGGVDDVVMVSSSNLNAGGATKGWNDLFTIRERPAVLRDYATIHAEMAQDSAADGDGYREFVQGPYTSRFFPKRTEGDPVLTDLEKVRCRGAIDGAGRNGRTAINVSMFAWNDDRGMRIARRLVELDKLGCDVSIIYGAPSAVVRDYLAASARNGVVKLWDSRFDRNYDGYFDLRVHHKYMLINGVYGGDTSSWRVHTGSQNWGRGTLHGGDESTLNVESRGAYGSYIRNWDHIARYAARRIGR